MTLLVVGGSGYLGRRLVQQALATGQDVVATHLRQPVAELAADWRVLDLTDRDRVGDLVDEVRPTVVLNAAYRQSDWQTTADGAAHLAVAAAGASARLVHVSSDAVFSGAAEVYREDAHPDPITPYGAAKAAAETAVKAVSRTAVIARTSLVIGDGDSGHEALVHALAAGTTSGALFADDVRCPVHVDDLASALLELARSGLRGVHHLAGADAVDRYELGTLVALRDGLDPAVLPRGSRAEAGQPGPLRVRLDSTATQRYLRTRLRGAHEFLRAWNT